jgi:hypothetical protein
VRQQRQQRRHLMERGIMEAFIVSLKFIFLHLALVLLLW